MKKQIICILVISTILSCGNGEPGMIDTHIDYITKNISVHHVKLIIFYKNTNNIKTDSVFIIPSNEQIIQSYVNRIVDCPCGLPADSAKIVFDNQRQITYRKDDGKIRNILDKNSYSGGLVKREWYKYEYNITNEDYDNAKVIK